MRPEIRTTAFLNRAGATPFASRPKTGPGNRPKCLNLHSDVSLLCDYAIESTNPIVCLPSTILATSESIVGGGVGLGIESTSAQTFEAIAPDASLLVGFGAVVVLCVAAGFVWANEVVPVSRAKLAISKNRGEVRDYLDELRTSDATTALGTNATEIVADENDVSLSTMDDPTIRPNVDDGRGFERWLFTDWLSKPASKGGRQKEPALPILKDAKWNSGDNPVLVTAAIMFVGVIVASITERVGYS